MPDLRTASRRPSPGLLLALGLGALGLALLCLTQPWATVRQPDAAGLVWEREVTGAAVAPLATALVPVAAAAVLASVLLHRRARTAARLLAVTASATAAVVMVLAVPEPWEPWWLLAVVSAVVSTLCLGLLLDPRPPVPRPASPVRLSEHERQRRVQAATWAALSAGEDPTARPGTPREPTAGTMSDEGPARP